LGHPFPSWRGVLGWLDRSDLEIACWVPVDSSGCGGYPAVPAFASFVPGCVGDAAYVMESASCHSSAPLVA